MSIPLHIDAVLATDPRIRPAGDSEVCELFVFIPDLMKTADGLKDHPIAYKAWGPHGRAVYERLGQGSRVLLNGELFYEEWQNGERSRWFGEGRVKFVRTKRGGEWVDGSDPADRALRESAFDEPVAGAAQDIPF